ncbi:MAG: AmmeMemoRadiSam system protein B, partial [Desulfurococcaceae archaeon]
MRIRKPVVAGFFYPSDKNDLIRTIEWSFKHNLGPGELPKPVETKRTNTIGYIAPHAGYIYSGPIAAHVFYNMGLDDVPDTVII